MKGEDGAWTNLFGANGSVYTATKLKAGQEYSFRCQVASYGGGRSTSQVVTVTAEK